ncbi:DUF7146 domain-containing protein [Brevundimonas subvibrioides]|uniref:Zinc finger CHC2-family protein n=1 Tax=Brevundimonas subvibrioides (strain ATCC 15264 / DSM 4735 / LMG 14903 / NBRC 16000 / CB 81) TaxID=633149 RepID=D9QI99_BRESC|nr:CHC2 zinc finger domain-containing protein [Brevundimonas subvibrioides]ADK99401.1 zinc finger CHC2-family protein [Brevundimonas subvibrioides ATCC 15264]
MSDRKLFEDARSRVEIQDLVKDLVVRAGSQWRGQCPLCKASKAKSPTGQFAIKPDKGTWRCFACGQFGDVVDLERELSGGTAVEAAHRLLGSSPAAPRIERDAAARPAPVDDGPSWSDRHALDLWREAVAFAGSLAERYLLARGIDPRVLAAAGPAMRFHPNAKWGWSKDRGQWIKAPALILQTVIQGEHGRAVWTGGVHATFLSRDGKAKSSLVPAKRMFGPQQVDGVAAGAVLIPFQVIGHSESAGDLLGDMGTGEGVESVLSVVTLHLRRTGEVLAACAALSLDRLQGGLLRDAEGCIDPYNPQPNPERPPFTWRGRHRLCLIGVDRDMSSIRVKARTPRGRTCEFTLDAEARARLCGRFASKAWKAAGAREARAIAPSPGCDFNDELRRVLAAEMRRA